MDVPYTSRQDALKKCARCAREMGMKIFALQDGGWCAASSDDGESYKRHEFTFTCGDLTKPLGDSFVNHVYKLITPASKYKVVQVHNFYTRKV